MKSNKGAGSSKKGAEKGEDRETGRSCPRPKVDRGGPPRLVSLWQGRLSCGSHWT